MEQMQKGFLHLRVRQKAQNHLLVSIGVVALAGLFVGVGIDMLHKGELDVLPFAIGCVFAALFIVGGFLSAVMRFREMRDPARSDAFQGLSRFGDPRDQVVAIEMEMFGETERHGPVQFTDSWMICTGTRALHFVRYDELRQVHHTVKARRAKGVVKVGESHTLRLVTSHEEFTVAIPKSQVENVLLCIRQRTDPGQVAFR